MYLLFRMERDHSSLPSPPLAPAPWVSPTGESSQPLQFLEKERFHVFIRASAQLPWWSLAQQPASCRTGPVDFFPLCTGKDFSSPPPSPLRGRYVFPSHLSAVDYFTCYYFIFLIIMLRSFLFFVTWVGSPSPPCFAWVSLLCFILRATVLISLDRRRYNCFSACWKSIS